jgi:glutaredoxin-related protein
MERLSGRRTVPQIFIDGQSFGGYDDIRRLDATGEIRSRTGGSRIEVVTGLASHKR